MVKKITDLQKKKGKKGFSMIELIIVIAIMAILIALIGTQLIPYLEKSRERKDETTLDTCLTNFKSAIAESEYTASGAVTFSGIANLPDEVKTEYVAVAGDAYDTDTEVTEAFKSKEAKGATVTFGITKDGVCYVSVASKSASHKGLVVSDKFSGRADDKNNKITSSGSSNSGE